MKTKLRKFSARSGWVALGLVGWAQFVPYGHDHANPPVTAEPPWYASVAPASWLVHATFGEETR